ncbi:MAG: hypothetical protein ACXWU1_01235 [Allosphingosinicella sp.]
MRFRDLFGGRTPRPAPAPEFRPPAAAPGARFHRDRELMFDIGRTGELGRLFAVPRDQRDGAWYESFWDTAWCASVELAGPDSFLGPDGFPYLRLDMPRPGPFDSQCLANLAADCLRAGVGAALFASSDDPPESAQYVLSMGLLDSLMRYDSPHGDPIDVAEAAPDADSDFDFTQPLWEEALAADAPRQVLVGTPSRDYLPPYVAAALGRHLEQGWALSEPRVQLLVDMSLRPHRNLVIGRKRSEFAAGAPIDDLARGLTWYLTPGRSVVLMPEDWKLKSMTPLRQLVERS